MNCYFCQQQLKDDKWCRLCNTRAYFIYPNEKPYVLNFRLEGKHPIIKVVKMNQKQMNLFSYNLDEKIIVIDGNFTDATPNTIVDIVNRILNLKFFL